MKNTYIRREMTLEALAAHVITAAACFAETCACDGPIPTGAERRTMIKTLERLTTANVIDERDDRFIDKIGELLVQMANDRRAGYGDRVLNVDTYEDFLCDDQLSLMRSRILQWQSFATARRLLRARIAARTLIGVFD
jgi:hypothetical protein